MREVQAQELMSDFAVRTGLTAPIRAAERYLWTDSFAVCNFLGSFERTGDEKYEALALRLVDQVHEVLGRHRDDDSRGGWISGLNDSSGVHHPTSGGLRIGKRLPERAPGQNYDEALEWDRDGQYFHYLTKWMHALARTSDMTRDPTYRCWAMELAKAAHRSFIYRPAPDATPRMHWKMSIDLSRPLVLSMGHHDPLDAWVTYLQLQMSEATLDLSSEISDAARICEGQNWETQDPLGVGGLLFDAFRLMQLATSGAIKDFRSIETLLQAALPGLEHFVREGTLETPADFRLAFRELGLCIGIRAVQTIDSLIASSADIFACPIGLQLTLDSLKSFEPLAERLENFWLKPSSQASRNWEPHRNINEVMLATSLDPHGYLGA